MQNTTFLHAYAQNLGNGEINITLNVSTSGGSEQSAIGCFKQASRTFYKREMGEAFAPPTHEIKLLAARPASETQRFINAIKRFEQGNTNGVYVDVLRANNYNASEGKLNGLYCPDALRNIKSLVKQARGW